MTITIILEKTGFVKKKWLFYNLFFQICCVKEVTNPGTPSDVFRRPRVVGCTRQIVKILASCQFLQFDAACVPGFVTSFTIYDKIVNYTLSIFPCQMHDNLKHYLDNCCLNRPFDDQIQQRIYLETEAKLIRFMLQYPHANPKNNACGGTELVPQVYLD